MSKKNELTAYQFFSKSRNPGILKKLPHPVKYKWHWRSIFFSWRKKNNFLWLRKKKQSNSNILSVSLIVAMRWKQMSKLNLALKETLTAQFNHTTPSSSYFRQLYNSGVEVKIFDMTFFHLMKASLRNSSYCRKYPMTAARRRVRKTVFFILL